MDTLHSAFRRRWWSRYDSDGPVMNRKVACGVVAGPLFVSAFTVLGARRVGYDWRRHAVSSLAVGREGVGQRANFMIVGGLYCVAARGLGRSSSRVVGPAVIPALVFAAGVGLIGSGLFVTDPVAGFPPERAPAGALDAVAQVAPTRSGQLHNLCAIPIFVGLPVAALISAGSAICRREYRWATYCAGSAMGMARASALFGAAFGGAPTLVPRGGLFQRISIAAGFGWLSAVSFRALRPASQS
jgi:Protein of unknown function (DUF998)